MPQTSSFKVELSAIIILIIKHFTNIVSSFILEYLATIYIDLFDVPVIAQLDKFLQTVQSCIIRVYIIWERVWLSTLGMKLETAAVHNQAIKGLVHLKAAHLVLSRPMN